MDDLIIHTENYWSAQVLITDNHSKHIKQHLLHLWKPRIFVHVIEHLKMMRAVRRLGLPKNIGDVINLHLGIK